MKQDLQDNKHGLGGLRSVSSPDCDNSGPPSVIQEPVVQEPSPVTNPVPLEQVPEQAKKLSTETPLIDSSDYHFLLSKYFEDAVTKYSENITIDSGNTLENNDVADDISESELHVKIESDDNFEIV